MKDQTYFNVLTEIDTARVLIDLADIECDGPLKFDMEKLGRIAHILHGADTVLAALSDKINTGLQASGLNDSDPLFHTRKGGSHD